MAQLIETTPIDGLKVYGQQMVDYTVQGEAHKAYDLAMARAAFAQTTAIELETEAYGEVLKMRQKKLEELGDCVAQLSRIITAMDADESDDIWPEDAPQCDLSLRSLRDTLAKYGVTLNITDELVEMVTLHIQLCYVEYGDAETAKANAEYAMDNEDNDLQQDMVTLQGLISKRDEAFNNASKIMKKYNNTARSIINMIGQ
ncbi:MAG: hypothetical protein IJS08_05450 [Victivallales bacterium]|nr:hypothetical protein [Victivallales bacterium]